MQSSAVRYTTDGTGMRLCCRCVRCEADREVPEADRPRMPATGPDPAAGVTVDVDTQCACGAKRVRIAIEFS